MSDRSHGFRQGVHDHDYALCGKGTLLFTMCVHSMFTFCARQEPFARAPHFGGTHATRAMEVTGGLLPGPPALLSRLGPPARQTLVNCDGPLVLGIVIGTP